MITLRYGKEYRMDLETFPDGKKKQKMVYVGPLYDYVDTINEHKRQRSLLLVLVSLSAILFIFGFSFYSNLSRVWFTSTPYAVNALVIYLLFESIGYFWKYRSNLNREAKQRGGDRLKALSLIAASLYCISFAGSMGAIVSSYISEVTVFDYLYIMVILLSILLMLAAFFSARDIAYIEKENPTAKEWEDK